MGPRIFIYKGFVIFDPQDNQKLYNKLRESTFLHNIRRIQDNSFVWLNNHGS